MIEDNIKEVINNVAAIVVSYNPSFVDFNSHIKTLKRQFSLVVIVDNSECPSIKSELNHHFSNFDGIDYISLEKNYGIARAQNIGVEHCIKLGFKYFCEFDQDSTIEADFTSRMARSYASINLLNNGNVAALGPKAVNIDTGIPYRIKESNNSPILVDTTLSSGLLVSVEAYLRVGSKAEELFIDLVDWEWCFRTKNLGLDIYVDPEISIFHKLGSHHNTVLGLFDYGTPEPFRHYYAFRNYIHLTRRPYIPFQWKIKYLFINIGKFTIYPLIMSSGYARFKYMCRGIYDGLTGRTGGL